MRFVGLLFAAFIPLTTAHALDYSDFSLLYSDAPFSPGEAAGISLLTSVDAVSGNPDGTFRPNRTLNRAEFLKIVLESHPLIRVSSSDSRNCFPDVWKDAWYSPYVCLAQKRKIVEGYPDGNFKPENPVNYAEALKILGELYNYTAYADPNAPWYEVYAQAARNHKTELPINLPYERELTRGQMTRLAAAYLAEYHSELDRYREAEAGRLRVAVRDAGHDSDEFHEEVPEPVQPEVSTGAVSSAASASSVSSVTTTELTPATSQLLQVGKRSQAIADALFTAREAPVYVRLIKLKLDREVKSIASLHLIAPDGTELGALKPDHLDEDNETWKGSFAPEDTYILTDSLHRFAIAAQLKDFGKGGITEELFKVKSWSMTVQGVSDGQSYEVLAIAPNYPQHQTTFGLITSVENALSMTGSLAAGERRLVGSFSFTGSTLSPAHMRVEHLAFDLETSYGVSASNWKLGTPGSGTRHSCSLENKVRINCLSIPVALGALEGGQHTISLYADVTVGGTEPNRSLQVNLVSPGAIASNGAVRWSDGTGHFTWIHAEEPVAEGTVWTVEGQ